MTASPADYGLYMHKQWRPQQKESIDWLLEQDGPKVRIIEAPVGCHAAGQGILMFDGSIKRVENIVVGDTLMGPDSLPRIVQSLIRGNDRMYRVVPIKGESFIVNADHILTLVRTNMHKRGARVRKDCIDGEIVDVSIREWLQWSELRRSIYKLFSTSVDFVDTDNDLPIDPYFLGVILGDGMSPKRGGIKVFTPDKEIVDEVYKQAEKHGMRVTDYNGNCGAAWTYCLVDSKGHINRLSTLLDQIGLRGKRSGEKFIPHAYKVSSRSNRLEILAGILDTDGYSGGKTGGIGYDYISKSSQLANDVAFITRSIGLRATVSECAKGIKKLDFVGTYYRVAISGELNIIPCRVARKRITAPRTQKKSPLRTGFSVVDLEYNDDYYGFVLDGDGRYLLDSFLVTHNSGKTANARAVSETHPVIALCRTRNLQDINYGKTYGFDVLFGQDSYPCISPHVAGSTCGDCKFKHNIGECEFGHSCIYHVKKNIARESKRASLNYAYFLGASWPTESIKNNPNYYLFLDEAHQVPDNVVIERAGTTINHKQIVDWDLPEPPEIKPFTSPFVIRIEHTDPADVAVDWLNKCYEIVYKKLDKLMETLAMGDNLVMRREVRECEHFLHKIETTLDAISLNRNDWYIRAGQKAIKHRDSWSPGFVCKPLTARHHFPGYFLHGQNTVLMSATIGNFDTFANELGISEYSALRIPSQWPPETRQVLILDSPRMGYASTKKDDTAYDKQADSISDLIKDCDPSWYGLIHTTSKYKAKALAERLAKRGLQDRIWLTPEMSTDAQMKEWKKMQKKKPGAIAVAWTWHEGVDLPDVNLCIITSIPFGYIADEYEEMRMRYDPQMYRLRAAWATEQMAGRIRRGEPEHYDTDGVRRKVVAIADANYTMLNKYYSEGFRESIVEYK